MPRGGRRKGAGRPKGTGKFGEPTKAVRLPVSMIERIMDFIERKGLMLPLYDSKDRVGHPGPEDDLPTERFDLQEHLAPGGSSIFCVRMNDDAMSGIGIFNGDLLVVDKRIEPKHGDVVAVALNGELIVRRLMIKNKRIELKSENSKFKTIKINDTAELNFWGVVRHAVHSLSETFLSGK